MPYYGGQPTQTTPQFLMERLMKGGLSREQAAALVGNLQKESSLITNNINEGEQAFGLMQWRGDRFKNLQNFATQNGKQWTDPGVQADFALHEMRTSESGNAQRFLQAQDITSANDALHSVIRYRDRSEAAQRGQLAQQAYGQTQNVRGQGDVEKPQGETRGVYAGVAQDSSANFGATAQRYLPQLRPGVPQAGQVGETAVQPVQRSELADASLRLQQAPGGALAMSGSPYGASRADEFALPANVKGMRGGIGAIGAMIGQGLSTPQGRNKLGSIFGTGAGQQVQQPPAGSPEMLSGFKGLFGGGSTPGQLPGAQSYIDPNTGSQMATGLPGRYEQGDVLNLGRPPTAMPPGQAPQSAVPMPQPRPPGLGVTQQANPNVNVASLRDIPDELGMHAGDFGSLV